MTTILSRTTCLGLAGLALAGWAAVTPAAAAHRKHHVAHVAKDYGASGQGFVGSAGEQPTAAAPSTGGIRPETGLQVWPSPQMGY